MGYFKTQNSRFIIGTSTTPVTLTVDFDDNKAIRSSKAYNELSIYVEYIPGEVAPASFELQFETGPDDASLFPETALEDTATPGKTLMRQHIYTLDSLGVAIPVRRRFFFKLSDNKTRHL